MAHTVCVTTSATLDDRMEDGATNQAIDFIFRVINLFIKESFIFCLVFKGNTCSDEDFRS